MAAMSEFGCTQTTTRCSKVNHPRPLHGDVVERTTASSDDDDQGRLRLEQTRTRKRGHPPCRPYAPRQPN